MTSATPDPSVGSAPANPFAAPTTFSARGSSTLPHAVRGAAILVLVGVGLGLLMGLLWAAVTPDLVIQITEYGPVPTLATEDRWFDADAWFAILGVGLGLILAAVAWWRLRQHPVVMLVGVLLASAMAALAAWWVGGLAGPADPGPLEDLATGTVVATTLGIRALAVLLVPSIVAVGTLLLAAALVTPREGPSDLQ